MTQRPNAFCRLGPLALAALTTAMATMPGTATHAATLAVCGVVQDLDLTTNPTSCELPAPPASTGVTEQASVIPSNGTQELKAFSEVSTIPGSGFGVLTNAQALQYDVVTVQSNSAQTVTFSYTLTGQISGAFFATPDSGTLWGNVLSSIAIADLTTPGAPSDTDATFDILNAGTDPTGLTGYERATIGFTNNTLDPVNGFSNDGQRDATIAALGPLFGGFTPPFFGDFLATSGALQPTDIAATLVESGDGDQGLAGPSFDTYSVSATMSVSRDVDPGTTQFALSTYLQTNILAYLLGPAIFTDDSFVLDFDDTGTITASFSDAGAGDSVLLGGGPGGTLNMEEMTSVPLPATGWMLLAGLGLLGFSGRRRA